MCVPLVTNRTFVDLWFVPDPILKAHSVEKVTTEKLDQDIADIILFQTKRTVSLPINGKEFIKGVFTDNAFIYEFLHASLQTIRTEG
jgi:hypothetical protein